ncbi:hypothetical protein OG884_33890 [Streptosporangium sp. NBC_01755]|uniref:hypothetical protein n=1 Tax=unclassified Streptosporangium TaxID=2632669 RepID=UPI002DDA7B1D|nr:MULTISPECIES: hypothetical protein [unclassified Streptosporangium]WSA28813.1 hypothetical protein OIE13_13585 [Streptosporangium sp. NBC_01810]WSC99739.1 hypothetical protein OG884_33890 [Streptosporangium sp. NBC_01755]
MEPRPCWPILFPADPAKTPVCSDDTRSGPSSSGAQGGGPTAEERAEREQVRLRAADLSG